MKLTKRDQMLECIEEIEGRQAALEGHDIWQDELVWWMAKAICLLLREAAIADRDELRAPSKPEVNSSGRADAQMGAGRWIPVSERLPEEGKQVLVCDDGGFIYTAEYEVSSDGEPRWYESVEYRPMDDVMAWMPLPKPWKGEEG